ncbi:MAG: hypothetical protein IPG32_19360 [Saprospirales bacterium]|nr:hypothetical protein [Saprospirales bacterium]
MNWKAKNKTTGREYLLSDSQKAAYEASAHTRGKYSFTAITAPKGVEKVEMKDGKKAPAQAETEK